MVTYSSKVIEDKNIWEKFVLDRSPKSFLQSWNWGETNKEQGKKIFRVGLYKGECLCGVYLAILENARRGRHLLVPGGPLIDWDDSRLVKETINSIREIAHQGDVWFVRVRPELPESPENRITFSKLGFVPAPMHLHAENTWVLAINKTDEELLYGMRKNTRYLVRKSMQMGLELVKSTNPRDSRILKMLQDETVKRHNFQGFPESIFKAQLNTFGKDEQAKLYMVKKGSKFLAAAIIIFYGEYAYYHHSASSGSCSDIPFSYFLQWNIIKDAREMGLKYYNFWGIAPSNDPRHRFAGVTIFKKGFGGESMDWLHAGDLPLKSLYWVTNYFERIRKTMRRL